MALWSRKKSTTLAPAPIQIPTYELRPKLTPARSVPYKATSPASAAAILDKLDHDGYAELAKDARVAAAILDKDAALGIRARFRLLLDMSGSMRDDFANGNVQRLVKRALAFGLMVDPTESIEIIPFSSGVMHSIVVNAENYESAVDRLWKPGHSMGSTNLAAGIRAIRDYAEITDTVMFTAVATDGEPDDLDRYTHRAEDTTAEVCELSRYPGLLKFLGLRPVEYLDYLDNLEQSEPGRRLVDNVNTQPSGTNPIDLLTCNNEQFATAMAEEWKSYIEVATSAGLLT